MRSEGAIYLRGEIYWCRYSLRGRQYRESTDHTDPEKARKFLRNRLKEVGADELGLATFIQPRSRNLSVRHLLDMLKNDLQLRGKLNAQYRCTIDRAADEFGNILALSLDANHIDTFIKEQLEAGYANATINRITGIVERAYNLAVEKKTFPKAMIPYFTHLSEAENVRQGFVTKDEFLRVHAKLPDDLQDFAMFAFSTGWRKGEISKMDWSNVQDNDTFIRMRPDQCKNRDGHSVPVVGEIAAIIERRRKARTVSKRKTTTLARLVFHRGDGSPVLDFRKAWSKACESAGLPNLLFHDLRRSAVTALVNSGVPQLVAMGISGHKTPSMFKRYNIKIESEQVRALEAVETYHKQKMAEAEARKQGANVVAMSNA
jgi:integrase